MLLTLLFLAFPICSSSVTEKHPILLVWDASTANFPRLSAEEKLQARDAVREMFTFGYDSYIKYAFPLDELDPIHCEGRGPDYDEPDNININDVLGDYSLTLIDSLDTLAVLGNRSEFIRAVTLAVDYVSFEKDATVQVFEATIRVLGGLLSAHMIASDPSIMGDFSVPGYDGELLLMAHDLAARLLPAFHGTGTGVPYPRVNLKYGVPRLTMNSTCTAGAGSLLLEFGVLSRLLGDPEFENIARRANRALWKLRNEHTGLFGNVLNVQMGTWLGQLAGVGAGLDSYYEYLLKTHVLFGTDEDRAMFDEIYARLKVYSRKGRPVCNSGAGDHPLFVNVDMTDGEVMNTWVDSLQVAFAGVQVLAGDVGEAICLHATYYSLWKKYGVLPERFNWKLKAPDVNFYPLRPEFAEATYLLYQATKNPFYLHVGLDIISSLNAFTRVKCGFATVHDVLDMSLEDRMESFFLSETLKYLYLLFDEEHMLNRRASHVLFSTEGHIFPLQSRFQVPSDSLFSLSQRSRSPAHNETISGSPPPAPDVLRSSQGSSLVDTDPDRNPDPDQGQGEQPNCDAMPPTAKYVLPLRREFMQQVDEFVGLMPNS